MIEVDPQPRIDILVEDALTGQPRRLTTYSGIVWYGGRVNVGDQLNVFRYGDLDAPFFVPDSLPYDPAHVAAAQLSTAVGVQVSGRDAFRIAARSELVPDPEGRGMAWLRVHLSGRTSIPAGLTYRVEVLGPPEVVLPPAG
jgi:hypothetical protein